MTKRLRSLFARTIVLALLAVPVAAQSRLVLTAPTSVTGGESFLVDISVEGLSGIDAFGFELRFNETLLTHDGAFNSGKGVQAGALTSSFANVLAKHFVGSGTLRVGGYSALPTGAASGLLCRIRLIARTGVEEDTVLDVRNLVDFPGALDIVPVRVGIKKEPLAGSGISASNPRGRRGMDVLLRVEGVLPGTGTYRGAATQLQFDPSVVQFVSASRGSQVPASYSVTSQEPAPGTLDLGLTGGTADLSNGELWQVRFHILGNASLGRSVVNVVLAPSLFFGTPGGTPTAVSTVRAGSVTVFPRGDANRSGTTTVADVIAVVLGTLFDAYADEFTDCDENTATNVSDVICTINAVFSRES